MKTTSIIRALKAVLIAALFAGALAHGETAQTPKPTKHHFFTKKVIIITAAVAATAAVTVIATQGSKPQYRRVGFGLPRPRPAGH